MNAQEEIPKVGEELEEARRDLQETLSEVNHKVRLTEEQFKPDHFIRHWPLGVPCIAAALGFFLGVKVERPALGPILAGALFVGILRSRTNGVPPV
jgi:ElaB/YqjD/DUF883 family membrane-anchored ribosome-binding protein